MYHLYKRFDINNCGAKLNSVNLTLSKGQVPVQIDEKNENFFCLIFILMLSRIRGRKDISIYDVVHEIYGRNSSSALRTAAETELSELAKQARIEKITIQIQKNMIFEEEEGTLYGAGITD